MLDTPYTSIVPLVFVVCYRFHLPSAVCDATFLSPDLFRAFSLLLYSVHRIVGIATLHRIFWANSILFFLAGGLAVARGWVFLSNFLLHIIPATEYQIVLLGDRGTWVSTSFRGRNAATP